MPYDLIEEAYDAGSELTHTSISSGVFNTIYTVYNSNYSRIIDWWIS